MGSLFGRRGVLATCRLLMTSIPRWSHMSWRHYSTSGQQKDASYADHGPVLQHKVLVSSSTNIYENLALEDWLFERTDFLKESIMLLWRNQPAVVIGRHQNPWLECNMSSAKSFDVDIARRKSGGGTVYHDEGNLNCSVLVHRSLYNRRKNLEFVVEALKAQGIQDLTVNDREDIVLNGSYKVSGTASRLSGTKTYHHFTLLCDVDNDRLSSILFTNMEGVSSKATPSVRMAVGNLTESLPNINFESLVNILSEHYQQQYKNAEVTYVDPSNESQFPGISKHLDELQSWQWIFGKCPPFSVNRTFTDQVNNVPLELTVSTEVLKGQIHNLDISMSPDYSMLELDPSVFMLLKVGLQGTRLDRTDVSRSMSTVKMDWIDKQMYRVETQKILDWTLICLLEMLCL